MSKLQKSLPGTSQQRWYVLTQCRTNRLSTMPRKADTSPVLALIAAVWICGFLWLFFRSSIEDPDLPRTALWSMMADEVLGLSDAPSDPARLVPQSGIRFLSQRLPLFSWAAVILVLAAMHGDAIYLLTLRRSRLSRTEGIVIRFGTGLGILAIITLCCGLAGHLTDRKSVV